jgi:tetratricopeptide (TPR) repeat protein
VIKAIGKGASGLLLAFMLAAGPATSPATQPAFAQDALELGSADFAAREAATRRLWWAAESAEPGLREAMAAQNPEAAERARILLKNIDDGIAPSTSPQVISLLQQYRAAQGFAQQMLIDQLRSCGTDGVRVLFRIVAHEGRIDPASHMELALHGEPRAPTALLLRQGKRAEAEALLAQAAPRGFQEARHFVAYWRLRPDSPEKSAAYRRVMLNGPPGTRALLEESLGDHAAALRDIVQTFGQGQPWSEEGHSLAVQSADWAELAREAPTEQADLTLRGGEMRALAARLAGNDADADHQIRAFANAAPNNAPVPQPWQVASAMCLFDRPAEAVQLLKSNGYVPLAMDLLEPQLDYMQELSLLNNAKGGQLNEAQVDVRGAIVLSDLGRKTAAAELLREAEGDNRLVHDAETSALLCRAARRMELPGQVDTMLLEALENNGQESPALFQEAGFTDPAEAESWWQFLSQRHEGIPPAQALHTLRSIAAGRMPVGDLENLAEAFEAWSLSLPTEQQSAAMVAEAAAWKWAGRPPQAIAVLARCADVFPSVATYMALGDYAEEQLDWPKASAAYANAALYDPAYAPAVFLHGWAMTKLGDSTAGRALMDLAQELPVGDVTMRTALFVAAQKRGLTADADRDRDVLLVTGDFNSQPMVPFLQLAAADSAERKDYSSAARLLEQAKWGIICSGVSFLEPAGYIRFPAQIHRLKAMAFFAAHQNDQAMAEAKKWYDLNANDSTGLIELVRCAQANGAAHQADELFNTSLNGFVRLLKDFPDSPVLHNQIAWEESRCRRNLDDALAHAQRAVDLAPADVAILDTLAETHYQRREFQAAIDTINRCIALEPSEPHHRKQLARFELGLKTGVVEENGE